MIRIPKPVEFAEQNSVRPFDIPRLPHPPLLTGSANVAAMDPVRGILY
jgi:hypothetical protein